MVSGWTNETAIARWNTSASAEAMRATAEDGDFAKRHLVNPALLRMLADPVRPVHPAGGDQGGPGALRGLRVLDAGCGNGYFSRMLAARGAEVVGVEPTDAMADFARTKEAELRQGVTYVQADLARLPDLGGPFDAVVCSMVLMAIPDWKPAMRACVDALRPGGRFVFAVVHPAFEQLRDAWRRHGEYRVRRYLEEYEIPGPCAPDFHRPLSAYLNELASLGCRLRETAEPALTAPAPTPDLAAYAHLPNFLVISADAPS